MVKLCLSYTTGVQDLPVSILQLNKMEEVAKSNFKISYDKK